MKKNKSYYKQVSYIDGSGKSGGLIIKYYTESEVLDLRRKCGEIYEKIPNCKTQSDHT